MSDPLLIQIDGNAVILTLSRPDVGNCLSAALVEELHRGLDRFEESSAKVLIFQGKGRHFCTGFDLAGLAEQSDADLALRFIRIEQLLARIWNAPYPTIAIAADRTVGAGADLFAACDRRIATSTRLDAATLARLRAALAVERGSVDRQLAELVRSVAEPGLKARMEDYRSRQRLRTPCHGRNVLGRGSRIA